ncbi:MAG: hypothetical protein R3A50_13920 [Saprospiraceae bacterium]
MIKRKIYRVLFLMACTICCTLLVQAQAPVFAYVQNANGKAPGAAVATSKKDIVKKVYADLLAARGDFRVQSPELTMNSGQQYVAWMDGENTTIGIEEKAFDICMQMGADSLNAIAALLSHEVVHYYEKHDWTRKFVKDNRDVGSSEAIESLDESVKQETQADYLGGFLALTAGYNVYGISARLLPILYKEYSLDEKLKGYPSLSDRIKMSQNASEQLKRLQMVFETAQYLSLLEDFETSAVYYRHILKDFPGREIYNNAGVNSALAALKLFSQKEMPYILPMEPDPNSRLYSLKAGDQDRIQKRTNLLQDALKDLDHAAQLDPNYAPALLNKACCYTLLNAWDDAEYWVRKYKKCKGSDPSSAMVLEGVLAAMQDDVETAKSTMQKAGNNALAKANLIVLGQDQLSPVKKQGTAEIETIDDIYLDDFLETLTVDMETKASSNTTCGAKKFPSSKILVHCSDNLSEYAVIQLCGAECNSSTQKGIKVGNTASEVEEKYGAPIHQLAWKGGFAWTYPHLSLLFEFDDSGKLRTWGCYRQSLN